MHVVYSDQMINGGFYRMRKTIFYALIALIISLSFSGVAEVSTKTLQLALQDYVKSHTQKEFDRIFPPRTTVRNVEILTTGVIVQLSRDITNYPLRPESVKEISDSLKSVIAPVIPGAAVVVYSGGRPLAAYVPPIYREMKPLAMEAPTPAVTPWVRRISSAAPVPKAGLYGRHLCLWGSHGWFYDSATDIRWEWQRPRMFTIVEDLLPTSFMLPYILPMLEGAGAITSYCRERDTQTHEVLVDDGDMGKYPARGIFKISPSSAWKEDAGPGFKNGLAPYPDDMNPHEMGHHRIAKTAAKETARARWIPRIPECGRYAVYVSYNMGENRATDARYTVFHLGGKTEFLVNQRMGGNTWLFLGYFQFEKGLNAERGSVELSNQSENVDATVSADCVKFGGGMGDIIRGGRTSGYPRYCEGARYWLQYAGVVPELVYKLVFRGGIDGPDYTEDYVSRAEYANFLKGAPFGPNPNRAFAGLHVPIDIAFAFHTDAGIKDGICGTLSVYKELDDKDMTTFPDGTSRLNDNRMLADLIQTQLVSDIRAKYCSTWTRRELKDSDYSETRRGNMPSSLLEFLSHQNFQDMKYALDPCFRFDASRAIYKAFLRFIAFKNGYQPVIQPLPPTHLCVIRQSKTSALITWHPQPDPLEPTAMPDGYIVYMRIGADETVSGFDNGRRIMETRFLAENLAPEKIYSFRVTGFNAGGEGFPSETLCVRTGGDGAFRAVGLHDRELGRRIVKGGRVLIVNAFDRLSGPSQIIKKGYSGFNRIDRGVGYMTNLGLTGDQWDFDPASPFRTNDAPGHGASYGDLETKIELGNTFDFTIRHGAAIAASGRGFDSASNEAVRDGLVVLLDYPFVDWLLGEERATTPVATTGASGLSDRMKPDFKTLSPREQELLTKYLNYGGRLFISGAYVATDLADGPGSTAVDKKFLSDVLRIYWTTNHGSHTNDVFAQPEGFFKDIPDFHFSSGTGEDGIYGVELPDSLKPAEKPRGATEFEKSETIFRYKDDGWSAAVAMKEPRRLVVFGFPFECICGKDTRSAIMKEILKYLGQP